MTYTRLICFDLDDTLVPSADYANLLLLTCEAVTGARPESDAATLLQANNETWLPYWREVESQWNLGEIDDDAVGLEGWRRALKAAGHDDEALVLLARQTHRQLLRDNLRLFDDALPTLELLGAERMLALISNGAAPVQRDKLSVLGLENCFRAVLISAEAGVAKPDPGAFTRVLDEVGARPEEAWHVGDRLSTDVAGANAAGLTSVWLNRAGASRLSTDAEPAYEIRSLRELPALLGLTKPS